tara:strand:- start:779 stop:1204 length:426 start_codon:yes stop_codon:yes gene_type:complete
MDRLYNCGKLEIKTSTIPNSGFGVFATGDIKRGELLEECRYISFPAIRTYTKILPHYRFYQDKKKQFFSIVLGYASMYNSNPSGVNAFWTTPDIKNSYSKKINEERVHITRNYQDCFAFFALKDIKKGDEIFTDYGYKIKK